MVFVVIKWGRHSRDEGLMRELRLFFFSAVTLKSRAHPRATEWRLVKHTQKHSRLHQHPLPGGTQTT